MQIPLTAAAFVTAGSCQSGYKTPTNISNEVCANNIDNPLSSGTAQPSPVTEIDNGSTDYIFTSVSAGGNQTGCTGACIYSWNTTSALPVRQLLTMAWQLPAAPAGSSSTTYPQLPGLHRSISPPLVAEPAVLLEPSPPAAARYRPPKRDFNRRCR